MVAGSTRRALTAWTEQPWQAPCCCRYPMGDSVAGAAFSARLWCPQCAWTASGTSPAAHLATAVSVQMPAGGGSSPALLYTPCRACQPCFLVAHTTASSYQINGVLTKLEILFEGHAPREGQCVMQQLTGCTRQSKLQKLPKAASTDHVDATAACITAFQVLMSAGGAVN